MKIKCGECDVFREEKESSLEKGCVVGSCSLYPEIPTILGVDENPKCKKGRPKGDEGFVSWGYLEISVNKRSDLSIELGPKQETVQSKKAVVCRECLYFDKKREKCPVFP